MSRMTLKKTVESLAHTVVSTATSAVRDPLGTAARATDAVKETAGAGIGVVRSRIYGAPSQAPSPDREKSDVRSDVENAAPVVAKAPPAEKPVAEKPAARKPAAKKPAAKKPAAKKAVPTQKVAQDPRDDIPGPDLAAFEPPAAEDLPEPIVIVADDKPAG